MTVNENTGEKGLPGEKLMKKKFKKLKNESAPAEKSQKIRNVRNESKLKISFSEASDFSVVYRIAVIIYFRHYSD